MNAKASSENSTAYDPLKPEDAIDETSVSDAGDGPAEDISNNVQASSENSTACEPLKPEEPILETSIGDVGDRPAEDISNNVQSGGDLLEEYEEDPYDSYIIDCNCESRFGVDDDWGEVRHLMGCPNNGEDPTVSRCCFGSNCQEHS